MPTSTNIKDYPVVAPPMGTGAPEIKNPTRTDAQGRPMPAPPDEAGGFKYHPKAGVYGAKGDPYTYMVEDDGSITIMEGPSGVGSKLSSGVAYNAIKGQIEAGILNRAGGSVEAGPSPGDMDAVAYPGGKEEPIVPSPLQRAQGREPYKGSAFKQETPSARLRRVVEEEMK